MPGAGAGSGPAPDGDAAWRRLKSRTISGIPMAKPALSTIISGLVDSEPSMGFSVVVQAAELEIAETCHHSAREILAGERPWVKYANAAQTHSQTRHTCYSSIVSRVAAGLQDVKIYYPLWMCSRIPAPLGSASLPTTSTRTCTQVHAHTVQCGHICSRGELS